MFKLRRDRPGPHVGRLNVVKMSIFPTLIYINPIPINISRDFLLEIDKMIWNLFEKTKDQK